MEKAQQIDNSARQKILNGNIPKMMLGIILPLFAYAMLDKLYTFFDTFVMSISSVGTVEGLAYLSEIKNLLNTFSWAITTAMVILVSQAIGAKDEKRANKFLTTTFYAICFLCGFIIFVFIGFGLPILKLMNTPEEVIMSSYGCYVGYVLSVALNCFNSVYIALERAKGTTKKLVLVNLGVIVIKMILSSILAFSGMEGITNTHFAFATIFAQCFMLVIAFKTIFSKKRTYRVTKGYYDKNLLKLLFKVAFPLFFGSFVFYYTKIFINSKVAEFYGLECITMWDLMALLTALASTFVTATRNTVNTVVAQNYGKGNYDRIKKIYMWALIIAVSEVLLTILITTIFQKPLIAFMTRGYPQYASLLLLFFSIQKWDYVSNALNDVSIGTISALGRTNANMVNQILRTLVIRVPALYLVYYVLKWGVVAVPLLPTLTNIPPMIIAIVWACIMIKKARKLKPPTAKTEEESSEKSEFIKNYLANKRKVLVFDCDGTILNHKGVLTDKTYKAIKKAGEKNIIMIATGRNLDEVLQIFNGREVICDYAICCEGSILYDLKNNVVINYNEIPREWVKDIMTKLNKKKPGAAMYFTAEGRTIKTDPSLRNIPKKPIIKFEVFFEDRNLVDKAVEDISNQYASLQVFNMRDSFSSNCWINTTYLRMTKGERLSKLLTLLGLNTDDAVVFGDSVNDISMFEVCKTRVALGNAVDELKTIATDVTKSYKEDGVAYWLNKNVNNKI